ncbi:MAG: carbohydrate kinase [Gammaproteobacteria bacterium]|jgi:fructokinase
MTDIRRRRPVVFGEVLYDRFPDGHAVLGGAPFNVAWHLQGFGQQPLMISRVGDDPLGREIRQAMEAQAMDTGGLQRDSRHATGTVDVTFHDGEPCYEIVRDRAWDFISDERLPPLADAGLLYHGSLALRNPVSRQAFEAIKRRNAAPVFIDVNLRDPWWEPETVLSLLRDARWAKMNEGELGLLFPELADTPARIQALLGGYDLEWVIITRGGAGARAVTAAGETVAVAPERHIAVVDTVGAGDAFASVLVLGLLKGWPLQQMLQRAQLFASTIVGVRGATVSAADFYQRFCTDWDLV